jgi:predicted metal-dependent hydrolase
MRTAAQTLVLAQQLLDDGRPFHAHEVLEGAWKSAPEHERDLWQGLAQLAVGLTHALRGNRVGATALLNRAAARLDSYAKQPPLYDIDVEGLLEWARTAQSRLAGGADPPPVPRLTRSSAR